MGEKSKGLELSNIRTKFWNTDVWADFDSNVFINGSPDPMYVSIPYLIVKKGNSYIGLLLDNPMATFMSTANRREHLRANGLEGKQEVLLDWLRGRNAGFICHRRPVLARVDAQGSSVWWAKHPCPPAWALGYHQLPLGL